MPFNKQTASDQRKEWPTSRAVLQDIVGKEIRTGSVPGGYFDEQVAILAGEEGIRTLFTSEPVVQPLEYGDCRCIGRITGV